MKRIAGETASGGGPRRSAKPPPVIDQATAEREIDQWLLKQATNASAKTEFSDIALGAFVFLLAFGYGIFASGGSGS